MRSHTLLRLALLAGSALYIVASFMLMSKSLAQGAWKGVEDLQFMSAYSGMAKLEAAGSITAVVGFLLTVFNMVLKSSAVTRPVRAMLIAAAVLGPVAYMVQSAIPDYIAHRLVEAHPDKARLAVDTYYWQRMLALPDVVEIEGFPNVTGRYRIPTEVSAWRTNLFFLVDVRQLKLSPSYSSGQLPYAYMFHYRYQDKLAPGESYLNTSSERKQDVARLVEKYITPADDILRVKQMVFMPYTMLGCLFFLLINMFLLVANAFTVVTGRQVSRMATAAFAGLLVIAPAFVNDFVSQAPGYQQMTLEGEFLVPEPLRIWALRYETMVMGAYGAIEDQLNRI